MTNKTLYKVNVSMHPEFEKEISLYRLYDRTEEFNKKYTYFNFNNSMSDNYQLIIGETVQFLKEHMVFDLVEKSSFEERVNIVLDDNDTISLVKYFNKNSDSGFFAITCVIEKITGNFLD